MRNDPAHPRVSNADAVRTGKQPTFLISDLSNPNLKPWVAAQMKKDNAEVLAGKIAYTPHSSCTPAGVPAFHIYGFQPMYFIQTPKVVVMIFSGDKQVRRVYLDQPHSANPKPSWYGESVGRYGRRHAGGRHHRPEQQVLRRQFPHAPHRQAACWWSACGWSTTARHWKSRSGSRTPMPSTSHGRPQRYDRVQRPMQEEICVEGNRNLVRVGGMPVAKTPDFEAVAAGVVPPLRGISGKAAIWPNRVRFLSLDRRRAHAQNHVPPRASRASPAKAARRTA